jgi:hypothetical protein
MLKVKVIMRAFKRKMKKMRTIFHLIFHSEYLTDIIYSYVKLMLSFLR